MDSDGSTTLISGCLTPTNSSQDCVYDVPVAHHLGMKPNNLNNLNSRKKKEGIFRELNPQQLP